MNRELVMLVSVAALGLVSCDSAIDATSDTISDAIVETVSADPVNEASSLLLKDDVSACANEAAVQAALGAANPEYITYLQGGGEGVQVDTISATAVNNETHEISCSSTIHYNHTDVTGQEKKMRENFNYKLRPALDGDPGGVIAMAKSSSALILHVVWGKEQQEINREIGSSSTDYPDYCQFTINGQQVGGKKCRMFTTKRETVLAANEVGTAVLKPNLLSNGKTWLAFWKPRVGEDEDLGIVTYDADDECIKNEIFAFC